MTCTRPHCRGRIIRDVDGPRCVLCGRSPGEPEREQPTERYVCECGKGYRDAKEYQRHRNGHRDGNGGKRGTEPSVGEPAVISEVW